MSADDTLVVEIPEIEIGFDPDGLPKTVAKDTSPEQKANGGEVEWSEEDKKQVDALRREVEESRRIAQQRGREAEEAKAQVDVERKGRTEAQDSAERFRLSNLRKDWDLLHSDKTQIETAINATAGEILAAKKDLEAAQMNADYATASDVQVRIGKLTALESKLEDAKREADRRIQVARTEIERELAQPAKKEEPAPPAKEQPKQVTPEEWIAGVRQQVGGTVADWLEGNKQFVTDPKLHNKMLKFADYYANVEEKPLNDPEFIKAIEAKFMPQKKTEVEVADDKNDDGVIEVDTSPKRAVAVAAPVSRATTPTRASTNNSVKVRLTPEQNLTAQAFYANKINPETGKYFTEHEARVKYGSNVLLAQRDGKFAPRE